MAKLFRQKALDRLQNPDQIDQLLQIIPSKSWWALWTLAGLVLMALVWSIFGTIPIDTIGRGILLSPSAVTPIDSGSNGQIVEWRVRVGDHIKRGTVVAILRQPRLEKQVEQARAKLNETAERNEQLIELQSKLIDLEASAIDQKRKLLRERIGLLSKQAEKARAMAKASDAKTRKFLARQRKSMGQMRKSMNRMADALTKRVAKYESLTKKGITSEEVLLKARQGEMESRMRLADMEVKLQETDLSEIQSQERYLDTLNRVSERTTQVTELSLQLGQLDIRKAEIDQRKSERDFARKGEVGDLQRTIDRLEKQLEENREVRSEHTGRILELNISEGRMVRAGQRIASIDAQTDSDQLRCLAYFTVRDGKRLREGIKTRISPSTVQRARFGSIRGIVRTASPYPVTSESAEYYVGNQEVARDLTSNGYQIEVFADLELDPETASGFAWTSADGPPLKVTAGTTATIYATIDERAPITFVIPLLREWTGI